MIDPETAADQRESPEINPDDAGTYLYGIGLASTVPDETGLEQALAESGIQAMRHRDLVAFTRTVPLSEFSEKRMEERLQDQEWLMRSVQHHHRVIAELASRIALLPSTFGAVYESGDAVLESLAGNEDSFVEQLQQVAGCDEWALHVFRDSSSLREQELEADPELRRMSEELESAPAGRAYLLRQQLERRLGRAIEEQRLTIADAVLDRVQRYTRRIQIEQPRAGDQTGHADAEIARTSLLVPRERSDEMLDAIDAVAKSTPGVRVEVSGPWPVYSFASAEPEAQP